MTRMIRIAVQSLFSILRLTSLPFHSSADDVIEKVNNECPSGYRNGPGKYCYRSYSQYNTGSVVVKERGECPSGYSNGQGKYCYGDKYSKDVVVKSGNKCPSGYRDGRGHYCYKSPY